MAKKKMVMYVYSDIITDARVQRAAMALSKDYEIILLSQRKGKAVTDAPYKNILVGGVSGGFRNILSAAWEAVKIIKKEPPHVVYCHDYYSALLAFYLIKTGYHGKIVYDAHELIVPEEGKKDRRQSFFYWFEKRIVKRVNLLVCASEQRRKIMCEHYGLSQMPLVIPNISQLTVNDDDETLRILTGLDEFFKQPKPVVVYAGVVTKDRHVNELLKAVKELAPRYKLLIVGKGNALDELKHEAEQAENFTCAFTGAVPYKSLGAILSKCDIGFVYYPVNTLNNRYCASNKVYEYASVGLPIIANNNPTISHELEKNGMGVSSDNFVKALESISPILEQCKIACQQFSEANKWSHYADKLCSVVAGL